MNAPVKKRSKFIRMPMKWSKLKNLTAAEKWIIGYLNTRSTLIKKDGTAWTYSAGDISNETGLSLSAVKKYIKTLETARVLKHFDTISTKYNNGVRGYKIYHLSRENLLSYMKAMIQKNTERWHKAVAQSDVDKMSIVQDKALEEDNLIKDKKEEQAKPVCGDPLIEKAPGRTREEKLDYILNL